MDKGIVGKMEFDTAHFLTGKCLSHTDVMYLVVLDETESTAAASHDTRLATIVDVIVADDVVSGLVLVPRSVLKVVSELLNGLPTLWVSIDAGRQILVVVGVAIGGTSQGNA